MKLKDDEILQAIRTGNDHKALEALYRHLLPHIYKLVNAGNEKEEEAKDILQEAMLIFFKQVVQGKFDTSYKNGISGFIYFVARNLWINKTKKNKRYTSLEKESIDNYADFGIIEEIENAEKHEFVKKVFSTLDPKCQQLLTLSIYEELNMKEVAERMGYTSANSVTVAIHRCKKNLIDLVKKIVPNQTARNED